MCDVIESPFDCVRLCLCVTMYVSEYCTLSVQFVTSKCLLFMNVLDRTHINL